MLVQLPNTKGYGGERLRDQALVPRWGGIGYPSAFSRERLPHPRPRTHWWPVTLATSFKIGGVAMSSVVTWYVGDLMAKACKTY